MKYIVHSRIGGTSLVLLAFACWLCASALIPRVSDWYFVATYSIAASAFFIVGCFLPEYRDKRYILGRRSVLQLMATFFGLAGISSVNTGLVQATRHSSTWLPSVLCLASFVIPFGIYHIATFLVRGIHAPVRYAADHPGIVPVGPAKPGSLGQEATPADPCPLKGRR
ncbi:hypothetical protein JIN84_22695 [Luteolibacter yonseiensis]|uniref:Uncharacterized protein n=1 Tax=Luteolibacter yonseiensis TaxID=1144680 RepID=A0A934RAD9_9BACT|nr:hypothetical protein [Luteolibacter yonseiensis]MBK1818445.1 hypothetical protein [Luteolibacter yonseiensis]